MAWARNSPIARYNAGSRFFMRLLIRAKPRFCSLSVMKYCRSSGVSFRMAYIFPCRACPRQYSERFLPEAMACWRMILFSPSEHRNFSRTFRVTAAVFFLGFIVCGIKIRVENKVIARRYPPDRQGAGQDAVCGHKLTSCNTQPQCTTVAV